MHDHFDLFFAKFGIWDYCIWAMLLDNKEWGWYRFRCYHDGAWLEGYDLEPVIYWGA